MRRLPSAAVIFNWLQSVTVSFPSSLSCFFCHLPIITSPLIIWLLRQYSYHIDNEKYHSSFSSSHAVRMRLSSNDWILSFCIIRFTSHYKICLTVFTYTLLIGLRFTDFFHYFQLFIEGQRIYCHSPITDKEMFNDLYFENTASFLERRYTQYWFILIPSLRECSANDLWRLLGILSLNCPE